MKKPIKLGIVVCLLLAPIVYLGFVFINEGFFGLYDVVTPSKLVETEGEANWEYKLTDGTIAGAGQSYQSTPGFIDNYIWSHQKVYIYLKKDGNKTVIKTIDVSKYKPFKDIYHYEIVKIGPDEKGSKVLMYWLDDRGLFVQIIRNIPLDKKQKWMGRVDKLPVMDLYNITNLDFPK